MRCFVDSIVDVGAGVVDGSEEFREMPERSVWSRSACEGSNSEGSMAVGDISSCMCDDEASVSAGVVESFGGDVEVKRSSHARFSSCNLYVCQFQIAEDRISSMTYRASSASNCCNFSAFWMFLGFGFLTSTVGVVSSRSYQ